MRPFVTAALIAAGLTLPTLPAIAVNIPAADAEHERMTRLPDDWLDKDVGEGAHGDAGARDAGRSDAEGDKADMLEARSERWEERGQSGGAARAPQPGVDCAKPSGTTGAILGAVAGGLLGNVVDGGRHRAAGTILGAGGGALLGREVEQRQAKCK
jgi:hypothetical protein